MENKGFPIPMRGNEPVALKYEGIADPGSQSP